MATRKRSLWSVRGELIEKSREAALSATRVFNDPMTRFKSGKLHSPDGLQRISSLRNSRTSRFLARYQPPKFRPGCLHTLLNLMLC